ncbi:MAG: DUF3368 domain-containing protein [Fimbriimonadales bacterium]|nr:DUF3368 domain-containing protein [Fimbriimonadales bacterium]
MNPLPKSLVVVDASVLIALASVGQFELLKSLFGALVVPEAVYNEVCGARAQGKAGYHELRRAIREGWITVMTPSTLIPPPHSGMRRGEVEVISVGVEMKSFSPLLLIDERVGRRRARAEGLQALGTLGILKWAKARGLLESVGAVMDSLIRCGFRVAQSLYQSVLTQVGETTDP